MDKSTFHYEEIYALSLALLAGGAAFAQNNVSTGSTKFVLLEEGTGTWCQYCPDGQVKMLQILANPANQDRVVAVALHNQDAMANANINTMLSTYAPSWPNGGVDRVLHTASNKVFMSRSYWQGQVTQQLAVAPGFQIDVSHDYNNTTRAISVTVKVKTITAQTGDYNINCYIVEDSVTGTGSGYNQINAYNTQSGHPFYNAGDPIVGFVHRHVARANLGGVWGTTGVIGTNPAANSTFTHTYSTYSLPGTNSYTRFKVVAFVTKHDPSVPNNRIVKNAVEAHVKPGIATGITEVNDNITDFVVYPNPATDNVFVSGILSETSDVKISIVNALGQTVVEKNYTDLSNEFNSAISLESLNSGMYFVNVVANGTKKTERIVINR